MPPKHDAPIFHSNRYGADSACEHCYGVTCHEAWCVTQNASVQYAYRVVNNPSSLTHGDLLVLHALGAAWTAKVSLQNLRG
jgi:hypothetical protein